MYVMTTCSDVSTFAQGSSDEAAASPLDALSVDALSADALSLDAGAEVSADAGASFVFEPEDESEFPPPQPVVRPAIIVVVKSNANTFFFIFCPPINLYCLSPPARSHSLKNIFLMRPEERCPLRSSRVKLSTSPRNSLCCEWLEVLFTL
jgi:hypothetical protein